MPNFVENLLFIGPDRGSLSFSNKFSTKPSIASNQLKVPIFFNDHLGSRKVYEKAKKKVGGCCHLKKNGDDVIEQKPMKSFKQIAGNRMAFFEIKSTCPSDFLKNIT
jgi:hypothetical protein